VEEGQNGNFLLTGVYKTNYMDFPQASTTFPH